MNETVAIAGLVRGREARALTARVVRKWTYRGDNGQGDPIYVGLVIADAQGDALYAEIPKEVMATKEQLLDVGKVYVLKKFNVGNAKRAYRAIEGALMMELSRFATIELARDYPPNIPEYVYSLTPFPDMVPAGRLLINYTDAIGYIVECGDLESFVPKFREKVTHLRKIHIKDLSGNLLKVTLWGDFAINFNLDNVYNENVGNVVVCLLVGCTPRQEFNDNNQLYLSGSSPFAYYLNPQIPEATPYYDEFKDVPVYIKFPARAPGPSALAVADRPLRLMTIADLDAIEDPYEFKDGAYKSAITITSIPANVSWWYMSCDRHKNRATQNYDLSYTCPLCARPATHARYCFSFMARDDTAEARFFAYDDQATKMLGADCEALMNPLGQAQGLPQPMRQIIGKRFVVSLGLSNSTVRQYVVQAVLERPTRRPPQADTGASSSQIEASSSQLLQSPSKPMAALMLQSPQQRQGTLCLGSGSMLTPEISFDGQDTASPHIGTDTPAQASSACRNLFGRLTDNKKTRSYVAQLSDDDEEAPDEEYESPPPKGKRKKAGGSKPASKTGARKSGPSDA